MGRDRIEAPESMTRRGALTAIVGLGATIGLGCGGAKTGAQGGDDAGTADAASAGTDASASGKDAAGEDAGTCAATPEGEVGPYFADDSAAGFNRSNILANLDGTSVQTGIPLTLNITVLDAENGCVPYVGAQVDIWHCNAAGVYSDISGEGTSSEQWLRGYQITDANGQVTFVTVIPGWYSGRTTHIHLRVRSSYSEASATTDETNTTQLFFNQALIDTIDTTVSPYGSEGQNPTTNAGDRVYSVQEAGANLLALAGARPAGTRRRSSSVSPSR